MSVVAVLLHAALLVGAALLLACAAPWLRARLDRRSAPPFFAVLHDWQRLLRKVPVATEAATPLLVATPPVCLAVTAAAGLLVPSFTLGTATAPLADFLLVVGLLGLCRVLRVLAACDAGSAPGGRAAAVAMRSATVGIPGLLLVAFALSLLAGSANIDTAALAVRDAPGLPLLLTAAGLATAAVALDSEDDPATGELSGWYLAVAQATLALRRAVLLSLVAVMLPPWIAPPDSGVAGWLLGIMAWAVKLAGLGVACVLAGPALRPAGSVARGCGAALLLVLLAVLFLFAGGSFA